MADPIIRNHTCGVYCTGDRHCIEMLARPTCTRQDVIAGGNVYHQRHGWQIVAARRAPEADVEAWRAWMADHAWGVDGRTHQVRRGPGAIPQGEIVAWLIWIAPMEETHDAPEP